MLRRFLPILFLLAFVFLLIVPLGAHAQDSTPESTPVVTVTPPAPSNPVDTHNSDVSAILEALKQFALIGAVVVLAFKTGSLIPAQTVDNVLARGFDLANGLADKTTTPVDNQFLAIAKPVVLKWVQDELAKVNASPVTINMGSTTDAASATQAILNAARDIDSNVG